MLVKAFANALAAALIESAPLLIGNTIKAVKEASRDTVETGTAQPGLRERLRARVRDAYARGSQTEAEDGTE